MIGDKLHVHMNATKWDTLTTFVKYLGKQGVAVVDETEKVQGRSFLCSYFSPTKRNVGELFSLKL